MDHERFEFLKEAGIISRPSPERQARARELLESDKGRPKQEGDWIGMFELRAVAAGRWIFPKDWRDREKRARLHRRLNPLVDRNANNTAS